MTRHPMQPLEWREGAVRFKANAIVRLLLDQPVGLTLNDLALHSFTRDDWTQFMQLIGYSVDGYAELRTVSDAVAERARRRAARMPRRKKRR